MEVVIDGFEHVAGHHCGSVAMADILRHAGFDLSEAMVFGLGSGLAFYYIRSAHLSPTRQLMGRSMTLEEDVPDALGLEFAAHRTSDREEAWEGVKEAVDAGKPPLVQCDLSLLPYWDSKTPFNGHKIVVAGYDEENGDVLVADTHFEGLQRTSIEALKEARGSTAPPAFDAKNVWWTLEDGPEAARDIAEAIDIALARNVEHMESPDNDIAGVDALREFADELPEWSEQPDAAWCYRYAYQVIERRGTGGGNFRRLYRDFLREAGEVRSDIVTGQLSVSMTRTAEAWSTLATCLEAMSRQVDPELDDPADDPSYHLEQMGEAVYQFETTFWDRLSMLLQ